MFKEFKEFALRGNVVDLAIGVIIGAAFGAIVTLTADHAGVPTTLVGRYGDALADRLRNVPGTRLAEVYGKPDEEITITLDADRAAAIGLGAAEVARTRAAICPDVAITITEETEEKTVQG